MAILGLEVVQFIQRPLLIPAIGLVQPGQCMVY